MIVTILISGNENKTAISLKEHVENKKNKNILIIVMG